MALPLNAQLSIATNDNVDIFLRHLSMKKLSQEKKVNCHEVVIIYIIMGKAFHNYLRLLDILEKTLDAEAIG